MLELLSPAGSYEGFIAAVAAGADAVYAGGSAYGARAYAKNFTDEEFLRAIDVAHLYGKRLYMTVNTLCKEREMKDLISFLRPFYLQGLDGVIVQDIGVIAAIRRAYPEMEVHASTQMTITGVNGARYAMNAGTVRIVPARELSLKEIKRIHDETGVEIECFIHGAMCYCYSGQCLLSGFLGGRSGNRGRCAQPCRLPYATYLNGKQVSKEDEDYVLSMKDLNTLRILPELIESGVTSFKIEGRMKKPEYTAVVTSIYRKYIDLYLKKGSKGYKVSDEDFNMLSSAYVRTKPEEGYYKRHNGRELITLKKPSYETELSSAGMLSSLPQLETVAYASFIEGESATLTLCHEETCVTVSGAICQSAQKHPLTAEDIEKQLCKTGSSIFTISNPSVYVEGRIFMGKKDLNELRRSAIEALYDELLLSYRREDCEALFFPTTESERAVDLSLTVSVETIEQLSAVSEYSDKISRLYVDLPLLIHDADAVHEVILKNGLGEKYYISLPYIFREASEKIIVSTLDKANSGQLKPAGYLVRNYEELELVKDRYKDAKVVADANVYSFNSAACEELQNTGADIITEPLELNVHEMNERGHQGKSELIIYGYLPMMVSAGCVQNTINSCKRGNLDRLEIKDRKDVNFCVRTDCDFCYNRIMNSVPLCLLGEKDAIMKLGPKFLRLSFTSEDKMECRRVLDAAINWEADTVPRYTKGHFRKPVE